MENSIDELDPSDDVSVVRIEQFEVKGVTFVIPIDAPVPSELTGAELPSGSLYKRLAPLDNPGDEGNFSFIPVSGAELLALERVWGTLQSKRKVYVLTSLPAARYDVLFSQAARNIGLPSIDWPTVSEAMASKLRTDQRRKDVEPWALPEDERPRAKLPVSSTDDSEEDEPTGTGD